MVKTPPAAQEMDLVPGLGRAPGGGIAMHFSILAWKIPFTEEPGGLQPCGHKEG